MRPDYSKHLQNLSPAADYLVREFVDNYEDGVMSRRDMLERIFRITGSTAATAGVLLALGVTPAFADPLASASFQAPPPSAPMSPFTVAENDPAIIAGDVTLPGRDGVALKAYWARPRQNGRYPAVLVQHENAGTAEHFRDVTRRFAKNGYVGLHLDLLSRRGGTDAVPANERGAALSGAGNMAQWVSDWQAAMTFLRQQSFVLGDRIGMTGYCFGGGITYAVAAAEPTLRAAAPYYGPVMDPAGLRNVRAAVLGVYGAEDRGVNASIPAVQEALAAARVTFRIVEYPGAGHAFFNDTRPTAYLESAATAAWRDTLAWFSTYLRVGALPGTGSAEVLPPGDLAEETIAE
jgi:carboxymethylenebutenolidase